MSELVPIPIGPSPSRLQKILHSNKRGFVAAFAYVAEVLHRVPHEIKESLGLNLGTLATGLFYVIIIWRFWHRGDQTKLTAEWQAWLGLWKPLALTTGVVLGLLVTKAGYSLQRDTNDARLLAEEGLEKEKAKNSDAQISGEILELSTYGKTAQGKPFALIGIYFNAKITFVNNSPAKTSIKRFYMQVFVGDKSFVSDYATEGATVDEKPDRELVTTEDAKSEWVYANKGRTFDNLYTPPVIANHTITHMGWLQFYFPDIDLRHLFNGKAYVIMVDHKNNLHSTEPFAILPA